MEHQDLLKVAQEAGNQAIKKVKRRNKLKKQPRIKTLPHGYYYDPSVKEMFRRMVASVDDE